tara:strand:+ start:53 stop:178 length:126 start_codon:yes stop_codon:yes gene_type:complete
MVEDGALENAGSKGNKRKRAGNKRKRVNHRPEQEQEEGKEV